jgi:hypothetical protein
MGSSVRRRLGKLAAATLAALLAMGWFAPSRALASCGDYVTITSGHAPSAHHQAPASEPTRAPLAVFDESIPPADRQPMALRLGGTFVAREPVLPAPCRQCPLRPGNAPCQGPWCSGNHVPMSVPTTVDNVEDHAACGEGGEILGLGEQIGLQMLCDEQHRVNHIFPIFHPPRPF